MIDFVAVLAATLTVVGVVVIYAAISSPVP